MLLEPPPEPDAALAAPASGPALHATPATNKPLIANALAARRTEERTPRPNQPCPRKLIDKPSVRNAHTRSCGPIKKHNRTYPCLAGLVRWLYSKLPLSDKLNRKSNDNLHLSLTRRNYAAP